MVRRGGALVLRSVLLATGVLLALTHESFAGCVPLPCGGGAPTVPDTIPAGGGQVIGNLFSQVMNGTILGMQYGDANSEANENEKLSLYANARSQLLGLENRNLATSLGTGLGAQSSQIDFWIDAARSVLKAWQLWLQGKTPPDDLSPSGYGQWSSIVWRSTGPDTAFADPGEVLNYILQLDLIQIEGQMATSQFQIEQLRQKQNTIFRTYGHTADLTDPVNPTYSQAYASSAEATALGFTNEPASAFPGDVALAYAKLTKTPPPSPSQAPFVQRWTAWASVTGAYNRTSNDAASGSSTATTRAYVGTVGMEYPLSRNTTVGIALGGTGSNWGQGSGGSGHGDSMQAAIYGRTNSGPAYLGGWLSAINSWLSTDRFAGSDEVTARFDSQSYGARLEGGYRFPVRPRLGVTPYAAVQVQYFHTPGYTETDLAGGGQGASYNTMNGTDTRSELGAHFDNVQVIGAMPVIFRATAAWAHDWLSNQSATGIFQATPGSGFTIPGSAIPPNSALASLEAEMRLAARWSLAARIDGQFANISQTYAGTATLRYAW